MKQCVVCKEAFLVYQDGHSSRGRKILPVIRSTLTGKRWDCHRCPDCTSRARKERGYT